MTNKLREKVKRELQVKEYYELDNRVYFKTLNGYIVYLPKTYYFQRLHKLQDYFKDRESNEARRLILDNLGLLGVPLEKDYPTPKVEVFPNTAGFTMKITDYAADDPVWGDNKDIMFKKSLTDSRGNVLSEIEQESWNSASERTSWVTDFALKIRDKLRKELVSD